MRAFIAIACPELIRKELAGVQDELRSTGDLKLVSEENIHLTVKFLGEADEKKIDGVKAALEKVKLQEFTVSVNEIGAFPEKGAPKVVWAGVGSGAKELYDLHNAVDDALLPLGFQRDDRFSSHFTLARVRHMRDINGFREICKRYAGKEFGSFQAGGIDLMQSVLKREGPAYSKVYRLEFSGK